MSLLKDMWVYFPRAYPVAAAWLGAFGAVIQTVRLRDKPSRFVAGLLPLLAIISFTVAFNFGALRTENRFLLPQSIFIAVYIGVAIDIQTIGLDRVAGTNIGIEPALGVVTRISDKGGVDPRALVKRKAGDRQNASAGGVLDQRVRREGKSVYYLPRFPNDAIVTRVDRKPLTARNPLPRVTELDQPFEAITARNPRFIVVNAFWVQNYLRSSIEEPSEGRVIQNVQQSVFRETGARNYFHALFGGELPYRLVHKSPYTSGFWPLVDGYESLEQTVFLFERARCGSVAVAANPPRSAAAVKTPCAP